MKRPHLILLSILISLAQGIRAQEAELGEQLLVFRSTGAVDLFYTSEVDSIVTNDTAQIFFARDTVLVVPLAELDSVAVGSRNEMKLNAAVRELTKTADLPWIIRFDGQSVCYRKDTPADMLPTVGMKLFCRLEEQPTADTVFPYGLTARVTAVTTEPDDIRVDVEHVELDDIFDKLFYAGPIIGEQSVSRRMRAAQERDLSQTVDASIPIRLGDLGEINLKGQVTVKGKIVTNRTKGKRYYHADIDLGYGFGFDMKLKSDDSGELDFDTYDRDVRLFNWMGVLDLQAALGGYIDGLAELSLSMEMKRTYHRKLIWTRDGDDDYFETHDAKGAEPYEDEAKADVTLDGKLSLGPVVRVDFGVVGKVLGARAKLKVGPEIEGKFGIGALRELRNYNPQPAVTAEVGVHSRVKLQAYTINRHFLVFGAVDEHKLFEASYIFTPYTWHLFPDYQHTTAVAASQAGGGAESTQMDVATAISEPPMTDIETGFEIVDPVGEVVDSVFVGTIAAVPEDDAVAQTFEARLPLPATIQREQLEGYTVRPVFHYAGHTVSAAPVSIGKDVLLQPSTATQSNGAVTFVSAGPFLGEATAGGTNYRLGAYLPVPPKNSVYKKEASIIVGNYIDEAKARLLIGTWRGEADGEPLTVTFAADGTGTWQGQPFAYELNQPQSGDLLLRLAGEEQRVLRIITLAAEELVLTEKGRQSAISLQLKAKTR